MELRVVNGPFVLKNLFHFKNNYVKVFYHNPVHPNMDSALSFENAWFVENGGLLVSGTS